MDPSKARAIFISAVENYAPDQWNEFLDETCGQDAELRRRVELLLKAHRGDDSFLDRGDQDEPAGGTEFGATRGHVVWRVGDGWRMAKELRAGDQLHSLFGAVLIDEVGDWTTSTTHNLIVQNFDTYFVGQPRLLTHDITARQVTSAIVPGQLAE